MGRYWVANWWQFSTYPGSNIIYIEIIKILENLNVCIVSSVHYLGLMALFFYFCAQGAVNPPAAL